MKKLIYIDRSSFFLFAFFFIFFFLTSFFKEYSFRSTFYDLGFYLDLYKKVVNGNYEIIFNNNFQIISYFLAFILKHFDQSNWANILFLIQAFCLTFPIFFLKNFLSRFFYLSLPIIWFLVLSDFHPDVFCVPLLFLIHHEIKKKVSIKLYSYFIALLFVKSIFLLLIIGYYLYLFCEKKIYIDKKFFFFNVFIFLYLIFYFLLKNQIEKENFYTFFNSTTVIGNFFNFSNLITFITLVLSVGFLFTKNLKYILISSPIYFFYLFSSVMNYKNFYNHYFLPIFIIFFLASVDFIHKKEIYLFKKYKFKRNIILSIIVFCHIFFSASFFSFIYLSDIKWIYSYRIFLNYNLNKITNINLDNFINKNSKNSILIENNTYNSKMIVYNKIEIFPNNISNNYDLVVLRSYPPYFLNDQICEEKFNHKCINKNFLSIYEKKKNEIKLNYIQVYNDQNITIYENKK